MTLKQIKLELKKGNLKILEETLVLKLSADSLPILDADSRFLKAFLESKTIENGKETQQFDITVDQYDQFRHFFLAHMFRDQYEKALENYPVISSPYQVTNVEVWVSNRSNITQSVRDIAAFQDLGEPRPFSNQIVGSSGI